MARLYGVNLPQEKKIYIALTYIYGIGLTRSKQILKAVGISPDTLVKDLTEADFAKIKAFIDANYKVEGDLRQIVKDNIRRLKDIKAWRGIRHMIGLPVRGQRTRHNARSWKGKARPVGGLNVKLTKK